MDPIFLDAASSSAATSQPAPAVVNVRPGVLFSVLEQHLRREKGQDRVIGEWRVGGRAGGWVGVGRGGWVACAVCISRSRHAGWEGLP